jgi:Protein of unknown function (DUF2815).
MATEATSTKVITGKVRFSYLHVFEPQAIGEGEKKYSVSLLIPKEDTLTLGRIHKAVEAAKEIAKTKFGGKLPPKFKLPMNDGDVDRPDDAAYAGHYHINANAKTRPGVVDKDLNPIIDQEEVYSGCYGRASVTFYPFDTNGNRGIACGLNNIQKLKDGEHLGGRVAAEVDFAQGFEDDEDFLG